MVWGTERPVFGHGTNLLRVSKQANHCVREGSASGLGTGGQQQPQERDDVVVRQSLPIGFRQDEKADQIFSWMLTSVENELGHALLQPQ